jgi:hypothetical protein
MKKHYRPGYDTKPFNENLNPLRGWLNSIVGKKWDKCYSEMCKKFDMRGVINAHILEHLYGYLEMHAYLNDAGAVVCISNYTYAGKAGSRGLPQPISKCGKDYYVCPKDGTVKKTQKAPRRSVIKQAEADKLKQRLAVSRQLSPTEVLHLIDGIWYHFDLEPVPDAKIVYVKPPHKDVFKTGYHFGADVDTRKEYTWDELNQTERARQGAAQVLGTTARDEFTGDVVYRDQLGKVHYGVTWRANRGQSDVYHANKKSAGKKHLKLAGLA